MCPRIWSIYHTNYGHLLPYDIIWYMGICHAWDIFHQQWFMGLSKNERLTSYWSNNLIATHISFKGPLALFKGMLFSFAQVRGSLATNKQHMHWGIPKWKILVIFWFKISFFFLKYLFIFFLADFLLPILLLEGGRVPFCSTPRPTPHNIDFFIRSTYIHNIYIYNIHIFFVQFHQF